MFTVYPATNMYISDCKRFIYTLVKLISQTFISLLSVVVEYLIANIYYSRSLETTGFYINHN
jgi:hypothetical protein